MASKGKSRWADDEDEDESVEAIAQRKREKEEKKRLKEEKSRKGQIPNALPPLANGDGHVDGDVERRSKRLKTTDESEQVRDTATATATATATVETKLLTFPTKHFAACRSVEEYERLNEIEEGSYGLVSRAREKSTGTIVALKQLKMDHTNDGFPVTGLREIQTLKASRHPHIVHLREVVMGPTLKE
jgi:cell division cycle 2-like